MKKLWLFALTAGLCMSLLVAFAAYAGSHRQTEPGKVHKRHVPLLDRELELDEAQRTAIASLRRETEKKAVLKRAELQVAHIDLQTLMVASEPQKQKIYEQIRIVAELEAAMRIIDVDRDLAIRDLLSDEQRQRLQAMRQQHGPDRGCRWRGRQDRQGHRGRDGYRGATDVHPIHRRPEPQSHPR